MKILSWALDPILEMVDAFICGFANATDEWSDDE